MKFEKHTKFIGHGNQFCGLYHLPKTLINANIIQLAVNMNFYVTSWHFLKNYDLQKYQFVNFIPKQGK